MWCKFESQPFYISSLRFCYETCFVKQEETTRYDGKPVETKGSFFYYRNECCVKSILLKIQEDNKKMKSESKRAGFFFSNYVQ